MNERDERRPQYRSVISALVLTLLLLAGSAAASEINACKYLVVMDFSNDPYGIAKELRTQGSAKGFVVVSAVSEVPQANVLKTCVMSGSWAREFGGGDLSVRVVDAISGALIAEAAHSGGGRLAGVASTVRYFAKKIYSQLGYTGYSEDVNRQRRPRALFLKTCISLSKQITC